MAPLGAKWRHMAPSLGATWRHMAPSGARLQPKVYHCKLQILWSIILLSLKIENKTKIYF